VSANRRTHRDVRRRRLGQNFLRRELADRIVAEAGVLPGELVIDIGAGTGAFTLALAHRGADVVAIELDPIWADRLRTTVRQARVVNADFLDVALPSRPFRAVGCVPFGATSAILRRLLDDPSVPLVRADLVVLWEVARKRSATPPSNLISTAWAPWWEFHIGRRVSAAEFRPVPKVDAAVLSIVRRDPPLLPHVMAAAYADFVRAHWPFPASIRR
jgi:23S rRNA (adenine-N6)-dimethyltransferase